MIFSTARAATWNFTGSASPEGAGTVGNFGQFEDGGTVNIIVTANPGWYISGLGVQHSKRDALDLFALGVSSTYKTNVQTTATIKSDLVITGYFTRQQPVFYEPLFDVTSINRFVLTASATGVPPLHYEWRKDGVLIPGQIPELSFDTIDPSISGTYTLTATNSYGSETTTAKVVVPAVLASIPDIFGGIPIFTNHVLFTNSFVFDLITPYQGAHIFYTLDGKGPTFASPEFHGLISIYDDTTLRAVVYTSDFSKSAYLDPIQFEKAQTVNLNYQIDGLGTIAGKVSTAPKGSSVSLRAVPVPGSFFAFWQIPEFNDNPEITVQADKDMFLRAVFAAPLSITIGGAGTVEVVPDSPGYTPGTEVLLYPKPASGSYFVRWSDPTSSAIPFQLSAGFDFPPTALFIALPSGQVSLTVISKGPGSVSGIATNVFPSGSSVSLDAQPIPGKKFLRWSGDATGTNASMTLSLPVSKIIYAKFENSPSVEVDTSSHVIFARNSTGIGSVIDFYSSLNLKDWHQDSSKTNFSGFAFESFGLTNSAQFFKAVQRER
jgi:hypothetical protein